MPFKGLLRVSQERWSGMELRSQWWALSRTLREAREASLWKDSVLRRIVLGDLKAYLLGVKPVVDDSFHRAQAAFSWLARAHDAGDGGGVSYGYFPDSLNGRWEVPYPETTGYIITTFLQYHKRTGQEEALKRALAMAEWEADLQMASGAVQGGKLCPPEQRVAVSFNTGMVLDGWCSVLESFENERVSTAARRAVDFLIADMTEAGYFKSNGPFVSSDQLKVFNCLNAWSMLRYGLLVGERKYVDAAVRATEAAILKQRPNGWISDNCLSRPAAPLTHTIAYSLQGILEVGVLSGRDDFLAAARRGVDPLVESIRTNGFLAARFADDWRPSARYACLTGSAQVAIICYRLHEFLGIAGYRDAGDRLLNHLKAHQRLSTGDPGIDGALPGSFPIWSPYIPWGYPNWATKYLLDALLLQGKKPS